jgi:hypothetical protein
MTTIETDTVTLPSYWASAIINGDYSGMTDDEEARCQHELDKLADEGWDVVDCTEESTRFTWSYRLYDTLADCSGGEVMDYTVIRRR